MGAVGCLLPRALLPLWAALGAVGLAELRDEARGGDLGLEGLARAREQGAEGVAQKLRGRGGGGGGGGSVDVAKGMWGWEEPHHHCVGEGGTERGGAHPYDGRRKDLVPDERNDAPSEPEGPEHQAEGDSQEAKGAPRHPQPYIGVLRVRWGCRVPGGRGPRRAVAGGGRSCRCGCWSAGRGPFLHLHLLCRQKFAGCVMSRVQEVIERGKALEEGIGGGFCIEFSKDLLLGVARMWEGDRPCR